MFRRGSTIVAAAFRQDTLQVTGPLVPVVEDVDDFDISLGGRIVYVTVPAYGGRLHWVDRHGSTEPITDQDQRFGRPRLSPNGSQLAVEVFRGARSDIGVYRFSSRILTLLTTDGASNSPQWHPDGRRIVFRTPRGLFWQVADGTAPSEVLVEMSDPAFRSVSLLAPGVFLPGEGSRFMFVVHGSTAMAADIFALNPGRDRRIEPIVQRAGNQWAVRVSPDGKWISYASDETGRFEVYIERSTPGQMRYQVSNDGGSEAVWSGAGNELFYRVGNSMMAVPITKNPDSPIGVPHVLFTGTYLSTDLPQYDVTPDGQRLVMVKPIADDLETRTIRVIDGWFDQQRHVPTK
jgi:serine/threonine-protein kinase